MKALRGVYDLILNKIQPLKTALSKTRIVNLNAFSGCFQNPCPGIVLRFPECKVFYPDTSDSRQINEGLVLLNSRFYGIVLTLQKRFICNEKQDLSGS